MAEARRVLDRVVWCRDSYDAMAGADALVIVTEWKRVQGARPRPCAGLLKTPLMIDLRNIYEPSEVAGAGIRYASVGRPAASP